MPQPAIRDLPPGSFIRILNAGGTITAGRDSNGVLAGGDAALPPVRGAIREQVVYQGLSEDLSLSEAADIAATVRALAQQRDTAGIVVTHGTDTLEETAFLCDLFYDGEVPVVFTGAQRDPSAADFDGSRNLHDALAVAADAQARGCGVVVCFGGRIIAARSAGKAHSTRLDAFVSRQAGGELGRVVDGVPRFSARPARAPAWPFARPVEGVEIVTAALGASAHAMDALVDAGACALVLAALGRGNAPGKIVAAVERARAAGLPVMRVSHSAGGVAPDYVSGARLAAAGVIDGGTLDARKARLLLAAALAGGERDTLAARIGAFVRAMPA